MDLAWRLPVNISTKKKDKEEQKNLLRSLECSLCCSEFNTRVEDKVGESKAVPGSASACQPADILEKSIWQRGQQATMKKTNVHVTWFLTNTYHSAPQGAALV